MLTIVSFPILFETVARFVPVVVNDPQAFPRRWKVRQRSRGQNDRGDRGDGGSGAAGAAGCALERGDKRQGPKGPWDGWWLVSRPWGWTFG